jgi:hypothetical protein
MTAHPRILEIRLAIESEEELAALRGALLAARASELAEVRRRSAPRLRLRRRVGARVDVR